eukprot:COSAG02_NODE_52970_length_304_cov_1.682927_1_plen_20_part_01
MESNTAVTPWLPLRYPPPTA